MSSLPTTDTIGAYEAKTHFSALLEKVEAGEAFTITKHGTPVARLVPIKKELTSAERRKVIERWIERSKGLSLGGLKIRDLINEGRR
jgi:prevent-host-death family protein